MKTLATLVFMAVSLMWPVVAGAQTTVGRFELAVHVPSAMSSQFDRNDVGIGGRFAWHPGEWVGVESELALYPGKFPDRVPFSRRRVEGLFGVTLGPTLGRARPFVKLRSGFLNVQQAPEPFPCVAIFPPPLACLLAVGRTLPAFDFGGGIELFATPRTFARIEVGDRLLKYPVPIFDANFEVRDSGFFSHDFRFAAGGGLRF